MTVKTFEGREFYVTREEARLISKAIDGGSEFITIGVDIINRRSISGIFDDSSEVGKPVESIGQLLSPGEKQRAKRSTVAKIREQLKRRGVIN
jgi:hypothetical protein